MTEITRGSLLIESGQNIAPNVHKSQQLGPDSRTGDPAELLWNFTRHGTETTLV